jgi:hypothetical protein
MPTQFMARVPDMIRLAREWLRWPLVSAAAVAVGLGSVALPTPASAWWRGGFVVGVVPPPFYFGPPVFYPPPVVYAPPPVFYAPPPAAFAPAPAYSPPPSYAPPGAAAGTTCYAGRYVCPLPQPFAPGSACSCPDNYGRRAYGQAR